MTLTIHMSFCRTVTFGLALLASFLLVWMIGAVGVLGVDGDDADLIHALAELGLGVNSILRFLSGRPKWSSSGKVAQQRNASANRREKRATGLRLFTSKR